MVTKFFEFRSAGILIMDQWETVVDPNFVLSLPVTPYRYYPPTEFYGSLRVCRGIPALVADTASLHR